MKLISKIFMGAAATAVAAALSSCEMEYYKEELYRKEIYLVSGENNIFGQEFEFGGDRGFISLYYSGTIGIDGDVTVDLAKDYGIIAEYNKRNHDQAYDKYALELPQESYTIDDMSVKLTSGSDKPYVLCPIMVTTDDLLPDEMYFIPLRIESVSDFMISPTKNHVLFQVFLKNDYATTKKSTYYSMSGVSQQGNIVDGNFVPGAGLQAISSSKLLLPTGKRSVRIMPGAKVTTEARKLRDWGISVTADPFQTVDVPILNNDGEPTGEYNTMVRVSLKPYIDSNDAVQIREFKDSPCYYDPEMQSFVLHYIYHIPGEDANGKELWYEISETMYDTRY